MNLDNSNAREALAAHLIKQYAHQQLQRFFSELLAQGISPAEIACLIQEKNKELAHEQEFRDALTK